MTAATWTVGTPKTVRAARGTQRTCGTWRAEVGRTQVDGDRPFADDIRSSVDLLRSQETARAVETASGPLR